MNLQKALFTTIGSMLTLAALVPAARATPLFTTSDLQLLVNTSTGDVQLYTPLTTGVPISTYEVDSASGSLVPANLTSIANKDSTFFILGQTSTTIAEGSLTSTYTVNPSFDLGNIFNVTGSHDLVLGWGDAANTAYPNAPVIYNASSTPEPATMALFALGGLGILTLGRKRKQA